jgi:hypothetical protein
MAKSDFTTTLLVDQTPKQAFDAINNVRGWWSEEIEGNTSKLNDEFNYHFEDIHRCKIKITESVPGKKVEWLVLDNYFKPGIFNGNDKSATDENEWKDTKIIFEITEKDNKTQIRFTHLGLVPQFECFDACSSGWTHYIRESLLNLITTGKGEPNSTGNPKTAEEEKLHEAAGKRK